MVLDIFTCSKVYMKVKLISDFCPDITVKEQSENCKTKIINDAATFKYTDKKLNNAQIKFLRIISQDTGLV